MAHQSLLNVLFQLFFFMLADTQLLPLKASDHAFNKYSIFRSLLRWPIRRSKTIERIINFLFDDSFTLILRIIRDISFLWEPYRKIGIVTNLLNFICTPFCFISKRSVGHSTNSPKLMSISIFIYMYYIFQICFVSFLTITSTSMIQNNSVLSSRSCY